MKKQLIVLGVVTLTLVGCSPQTNDTQISENQTLDLAAETNTNQQTTENLTMPDETSADTQLATAEKVVLKTSKGDITLKLYPQEAPNTVSNFVTKAQDDYYKDLTFHRVEDWVVQGGDPLGTGTGGGSMPTELNQVEFKEGSLGVARGGNIQISNDSQFFICTQDCSWLTGQYTNFGEVVEGMDIVKQIEIGDTILGLEVAED